MVRTTDVRKHDRTLPSGKTVSISKHKRKIPFDEKKFEPVSDGWAKEMKQIHFDKTHPDALNDAQITFVHGNMLWAMNPNKYDVLGLDAKNVPKYEKKPKKCYPNQIINVKGKFYQGNKHGHFARTFPPKIKRELN